MPGTSEDDVSADTHLARTRETGGADPERDGHPGGADADAIDAEKDGATTTGTDENEEFVGRVAGQDAGYSGETGAEARAEASRAEG